MKRQLRPLDKVLRRPFETTPQSVSSPDWSCCALHEWPVFPPRGSADDLCTCGIFCAASARSGKTEFTDWAYSVEKLVAASANI